VLPAVTGIYGVMSYFVNERTRKFGIRVDPITAIRCE